MYTILINDDNTMTKSVVEKIMHRSTGVQTIQFLMNPTYGDYDMTEFTIALEYKTPISNTYTPIVITPEADLYKERLQFLFPVTIDLTKEVGDVEIKFTMVKLELNDSGETKEYVRQIPATTITITPVERWDDYISDANLGKLAEILMTNEAEKQQLKAYADQIYAALDLVNTERAVDIKLDAENDNIHLIDTQGNKLGEGINTTELGDEIVEASNDGLVEVITI